MVPQLADTGFQVLFHSPPGVLFTFPSQYSALSVTRKYSALRGGPRSFPQGFPCPVVLRMPLHAPCLRLRGFHPLRHAFPGISAGFPHMRLCGSLPRRAMHAGLGSFPFARRYSGNRCFFLFLRLLRCFSSPGSPPHTIMPLPALFMCGCMRFPHAGFPIQTPMALWVFAPPHGFSQLVASFFGSWCQGIRPVPLSA